MSWTRENDTAQKDTRKGLFIVIEGIDHVGKETQSKLLVSRLVKNNIPVSYFDFPQYGKRSASFVEDYLAGDFGDTETIDPKVASLFYTLDRFTVKNEMIADLDNGKVIVSNRYIASNLTHQGAKISEGKEKTEFWEHVTNFEFTILGMPKPDMTFILMLPMDLYEQFFKKPNQLKFVSSKGFSEDLHEKNFEHQKKARENYLLLAKLYPEQYKLIDCADENKKNVLSINVISDKIWAVLQASIH